MVATFWSLHGTKAQAAESCTGPEVVAEAGLRPVWRVPVSELAPVLSSAADIERCATIHVRAAAAGAVEVEVRLPDGRSTTRHLQRPDELTTVVQSLLTNLPVASGLPEGAPTAAPGALEPATKEPSRREVSVGIGTSLHIAARPTFLGYGLTADTHGLVSRWLFGAWLRWDVAEHAVHQRDLPRDLSMSSFLLGGYAGARFDLGALALEATLGPNVLLENQEAFEGTREDVGGDFVELSVGANLRLLAPASSAWRGFALLGGDVYPGRVGHEQRHASTLPALPAFSATLALGAAWSTL